MTGAAQSENVLTPEFARTLVRLTALRTGTALFDDDLIQEALLRGLVAFRRTAHVRYPRAFFSKIVRDTVRDHWRRRGACQSLEMPKPDALAQTLHFEHSLDRARQFSQLHEALNVLSPTERELVKLFYFEEIPIATLSTMLGKSRSALKMSLLRSRFKLGQAMSKNSPIHRLQP
jgi:RNA polymerase sigma factor (sigma-70 family)